MKHRPQRSWRPSAIFADGRKNIGHVDAADIELGEVRRSQPHFLSQQFADLARLVQQGRARRINRHDIAGGKQSLALHQIVRVLLTGPLRTMGI